MYVSLPLPLSELIAFVVGEVHLWTDRALKAILRRASKFIPWPTAIQRSIIKEQFERNYGIPDCIGLMDGCQVNLRAQPAREDARAFHNWKNKSGLLFVAIVDCDCAFATYNSDHPALSSDHRVQLFMNVFTEHRQYFSPSQYVLADSGFTATELCVSMFTKSARQSVLCGQAAYFDMKAAPHACQGGADIWLLKSRFPALRSLGQHLRSRRDQARTHAFIVAAVVLHNLFLKIHPLELDARDMQPAQTHADQGDADEVISQPGREALIDRMLELDGEEWHLDTLELWCVSYIAFAITIHTSKLVLCLADCLVIGQASVVLHAFPSLFSDLFFSRRAASPLYPSSACL